MPKNYMFIDQHGDVVWAHTVAELCASCGRKGARKMYADKKDGKSYHTGYIVAGRWFRQFEPVERPA